MRTRGRLFSRSTTLCSTHLHNVPSASGFTGRKAQHRAHPCPSAVGSNTLGVRASTRMKAQGPHSQVRRQRKENGMKVYWVGETGLADWSAPVPVPPLIALALVATTQRRRRAPAHWPTSTQTASPARTRPPPVQLESVHRVVEDLCKRSRRRKNRQRLALLPTRLLPTRSRPSQRALSYYLTVLINTAPPGMCSIQKRRVLVGALLSLSKGRVSSSLGWSFVVWERQKKAGCETDLGRCVSSGRESSARRV